jgi:peptidase S41-like protein
MTRQSMRAIVAPPLFATLAMFVGACLGAQAPAQAGQAAVAIPSTPAGKVLQSWLSAFDSGDSATMEAYYQRYEPDRSAASEMDFRNQTGGFDLLKIEKSEPRHIEFLVKERKGSRQAFGSLDLSPGEPGVVKDFGLQALPPGATIADFRVDAAERARVIDGAIAKLDESYVFPETAKRMADSVRARAKRGEYDDVTNGMSFARMLTDDFQSVSHDRHLRVNFSPSPLPERNQSGPTPEQRDQMRRQMERDNCGFVKAELLEGNIGYLKFNFFGDPEICGPTASAAMNFLANADALIIDLRDNGGGSPKMVTYMCSYLFAQRTHVNDLWTRRTNSTEEFWTHDVPGKRLPDNRPVYVLTSKRTFSGGEEFTYDLKNLKRATIVGETTGGGAHPVAGQRIDEHFIIGVPFARAISPITKTNWEGTGVEPDVKVPAAQALTTAQKLAAEKKPTT